MTDDQGTTTVQRGSNSLSINGLGLTVPSQGKNKPQFYLTPFVKFSQIWIIDLDVNDKAKKASILKKHKRNRDKSSWPRNRQRFF